MANKESKLEKKTLKEKLTLEGKRIGLSLVPYKLICDSFSKSKNVLDIFKDESGDFTKRTPAYLMVHSLSTFSTVLAIGAYTWMSIDTKTLDYKKWPEIQNKEHKEQVMNREKYEEKILEKTFNYFDFNKDERITKDEFEKGVENAYKNNLGVHDFYNELNWNLNLGEENISKPSDRK